ncbi:NADH:flavin oxidoreductase [Sneathiella sp.]|jgi:2,4-dienoyl-CoA reductase-like NADH-dependent reductase (Old Yellow Enzyme family)|uniref:NADH:flavin oxidoreductase n=1 Tax=Sneathiella sp. TaxID=1964365 RepID=UPI0039E3EE36
MNKDLFTSLNFNHGSHIENRLAMAPITNMQSHDDGRLSDEEYKWLTMRANAGFGLTMTCGAFTEMSGKGFPGQLGIHNDDMLPGLTKFAKGLKEKGSLAIVQLIHGGMRAAEEHTGTQPVSASDQAKFNARGLTTEEVKSVIENYIQAALRAEKAGFDGVEVHGAHGYLLCQFLSATLNQRTDDYGGSAENRARIIFEIVDGIREKCRPDFNISVRLSPERFGMQLEDALYTAKRLFDEEKIDFLDVSLWDFKKEPEEEAFKGKKLMSYFTELDRKSVKLTVAGKIMSAADVELAYNMGADFVMAGRAGILHHDFVEQIQNNTDFESAKLPVSEAYLAEQGLSDTFVKYMATWDGFVSK